MTDTTACCSMPHQHTHINPWPLPMDPSAGQLVRIVRTPHRAYPTCDVREWPESQRWDRPKGEPYPWCPNRARWTWNEQHLCDEHADAYRQGRALHGIYPDGRWCRVKRGVS